MTTATASDAGSTSQKSSEVSPEQEYFLYELENTDSSGSMSLVLRAMYDGGDVSKFMRALERKIRHYDKDIERLCNFHYHGFVEAITELVAVKKQCRQLREQIEAIDQHLDESTKTLLQKAEELVRYRKMQKNIASAIDAISLCLPLLEKYAKLQEQMASKRYYPALKTLEQLENTYMPRVSNYRFVQMYKKTANDIREQIMAASKAEFTDFLEGIRKVSAYIGEVAQRHAAEHMDVVGSKGKRGRLKSQSPLHSSSNSTPQKGADDEDDFSAQDHVDFSPIYRSCHIHSVLGVKEKFELQYRDLRKSQAELAFRPPDRAQGRLEPYVRYFNEVIGFLVIEDHVMHTAPGLVTRQYREMLWKMASEDVTTGLSSNFEGCRDPALMLSIKKSVLLFAVTLKGYGFQVQPFYKLLQSFRDQYNEILITQCCSKFDDILRTDNYTPITVENEEEYKKVIDRFPWYNRVLEEEKFPKKFPFSEFVPLMYERVKDYIKDSLRFTEDLGLSQTDVDDTVRRATNALMDRIAGSLKSFISSQQLTLVQLVQITINMGYLEKSCESLEQYITRLTGAAQSSAHAVKLRQGAFMFNDARTEVEQQIYEALKRKISEFLELASYDWEVSEASGRASGFVMDLIAFQKSTFQSFTNLPITLARASCMEACKHLSNGMKIMLEDPEVRYISMAALEQFNLDVMQCEQFAMEGPVPGLDGDTLAMTFADLRQLLDLFLFWDWSSYLADFGKDNGKYVRVKPATAITVLEKVIELDRKKNSGLFARGGKDKDKKKLLETVLKQLRTFANGV